MALHLRRLLLAEPNWKQRFQGRDASAEYGVSELGYSPRKLKKLLREAGFTDIRRFHNALLDDGAMPLTLLEARIDEWIEMEQAKK